jgi:hypothetical protein
MNEFGPPHNGSIVMTGLVTVIRPNASAFGDVVRPPDCPQIVRKRRHVDGRDKPGHDGKGGSGGSCRG